MFDLILPHQIARDTQGSDRGGSPLTNGHNAFSIFA